LILKKPLWEYKAAYRFLRRTSLGEIIIFHKLLENKEIIAYFGIKESNRFKVYKLSYNPSSYYQSCQTVNKENPC